MQSLDKPVKIKDCKKLETFELKKEYHIIAINKIPWRGKNRYTFKIDGEDGYYVSNTSLEEKELNMESSTYIPFRLIEFKTTKSKNKEVVISI